MKMVIKPMLSEIDVPLGAAVTCKLVNESFEWGKTTKYQLDESVSLVTSHSISRHVARLHPTFDLYPANILHRTEVDHWLTLSSGPMGCKNEISSVLYQLNKALAPSLYLTADALTIADIEVFAALYKSTEWRKKIEDKSAPPHVMRWYNHVNKKLEDILSTFPNLFTCNNSSVLNSKDSGTKREEGGKFVELPGAKMGEVVVRFPPEASGYLHIGHAKAALLNQYYQKEFKGKLIMRFDDTNPAKEDAEFERVILEDLKLLEIEPDVFTHTSDYFEEMLVMCENLIKEGKAYADDTDPETMKKERDERTESKNRSNTVEKNLKMWSEMKSGSDYGQSCCIRAKIDMNSPNGCLRDPTIYRCKNEPHIRTGHKYKVYPTYDFACPIVDSVEGVTHALRTTEYHDRDDQYYWFIENLSLRSLHIYEYSRLNMNNTVLSKRKLTWFVKEGLVDGWDDPRFPTVRGILRRGMTIEGLKDFIIAQGSSRSVVNMEWDKIWAFNKKVIDQFAPRFTALQGDLVPVNVRNAKEESKLAQKHPKDATKGMKTIWMGPKILIESEDAIELKEGENTTFINWGNLKILKINKIDGKIVDIDAETNLSNEDYKKTLKLTWLAETKEALNTPVVTVYFDHLISKSVLGKDEDFKDFIPECTRKEVQMVGDDELKLLKVGDIIQLQRKGFFRVDDEYKPMSLASCKESPVVLVYIPDGHSKETTSNVSSKKASGMSMKEIQSTARGKTAEKSPQEEAKPLLNSSAVAEIHLKIKIQGDVIRTLKAKNADKALISPEVELLKTLKAQFKDKTGIEWKPEIDVCKFTNYEAVTPAGEKTESSISAVDIHTQIKAQGDKIRLLKADKADKSVINTEVSLLKSLKDNFKKATGLEWKPEIDINQFVVKSVPDSSKADESAKINSSSVEFHAKIAVQGDKIRTLKASKADKSVINPDVDVLKELKNEFKNYTNVDWKPDIDINKFAESKPSSASCSSEVINLKIKNQGDKIRNLKSSKADKSVVMAEVEILKALKSEFKGLTGTDWQPEGNDNSQSSSGPVLVSNSSVNDNDALELLKKIKDLGDKIRNLKSSKADKAEIMQELESLKMLKAKFKDTTGTEWKVDIDINQFSKERSPSDCANVHNSKNVDVSCDALTIHEKIKEQGVKVRNLKNQKAAANAIKVEVDLLLTLKAEFKSVANFDWKPDIDPSTFLTKSNEIAKPTIKKEPIPPKVSSQEDASGKKQTRLGLEVKKEENFSAWYSQVITKSEMIEYYNVSGCYILRPWSYAIWDFIKSFFDHEIKKLGVENSYFPMFVAKEALEREKTHIADFSPEVAWVTRSGSTEMAEPVAIRPTSETVMYPAFAKWIQSHRDLPLKLNQWNNVVRWEFKQPTPFLRTREFLWQEGHTAFATKEEATQEVYTILELYTRVYQELLAIPVVKGRKTEKEKFAGGDFTTTTEAYIRSSGRAIQGATSHHLGQNFSKMFNIVFEDPKTQEEQFVYQNSWGLTTRTIGVMVMVHGDDKGLVLPPKVAVVQVIIMPVGITAKSTEEDKEALTKSCSDLMAELVAGGIRARCDFKDNVTPAWKFNHWELKGVPIRIELGPREVKAGQVFTVRRDTAEKQAFSRANICSLISSLLEDIHKSMYQKALSELNEHKATVTDWPTFLSNLEKGNLVVMPFCGSEDCEDAIKKDSARDEPSEAGAPSMGAKGLCIPFEQPGSVDGLKCIHPKCSRHPQFYALFGRSY